MHRKSKLAASAFTNIYPGIINFSAGNTPLPIGANLLLNALYNMTIAQFVNLVNQELPEIQAKLAPANPQRSGSFSVTGTDVDKQRVGVFPTHFPLARSYQTSLGIQRDLGHGMVIAADWRGARAAGPSTKSRRLHTISGRIDWTDSA